MEWRSGTILILIVGILLALSGCSSLGYDDAKFKETWKDHIGQENALTNQFNAAMDSGDIPTVKIKVEELRQLAISDYKKVKEYSVSPSMETSHYYFLKYLNAEAECNRGILSMLQKWDEGNLEHKDWDIELLKTRCSAIQTNLESAQDSLPN